MQRWQKPMRVGEFGIAGSTGKMMHSSQMRTEPGDATQRSVCIGHRSKPHPPNIKRATFQLNPTLQKGKPRRRHQGALQDLEKGIKA